MKVDLYERIWMWAAAGLIALFLGAISFAVASQAMQPPSHIETIDPTTVYDPDAFGEPGVVIGSDGRAVVTVIAEMFAFDPDPIVVPAGRPVTFRITSPDVIHGFHVPGTNVNAMVLPGYVTEFTVSFPKVGEKPVLCHEYCGLLHHEMIGSLVVEEAP